MKKNSKKFAIIGTLALVAAMFISCGPKETPIDPIDPNVHPAWLKAIAVYPDESVNEIGIIMDSSMTGSGASLC